MRIRTAAMGLKIYTQLDSFSGDDFLPDNIKGLKLQLRVGALGSCLSIELSLFESITPAKAESNCSLERLGFKLL